MIINPIWFYLVGIATTLKIVIAFIAALIIVIAIVTAMDKGFIKEVKRLCIIGSILTILFCLIPSEKTCYQMMVASLVTKDNVEYVTETGKDIVDYIIESVDIIMEDND